MNIADSLNIKKHCSQYRVGLWGCPQFLFVLMGVIICSSILAIYIIGQNFYDEPEIIALITLATTAVLFIIGHIIISSFERMAKASQAKSEFISIMSHELRSPLAAIKWQMDVLLSDISSPFASSPDATKYLETIDEQNERMIRAVNDLLEVNRIEDKDLVLRPALFSLEELTKNIISKNKQYSANENLRIIGADEKNTIVLADEERIKRVINHLIDNATRYNIDDKPIEISIEPKNSAVYWKITNKGMGILPEERDRIFQKFFRSPHMVRFQTGGSGVGLFIAKSIVEMSGGSIGFKSSKEDDTFFWFTLPSANIKT